MKIFENIGDNRFRLITENSVSNKKTSKSKIEEELNKITSQGIEFQDSVEESLKNIKKLIKEIT